METYGLLASSTGRPQNISIGTHATMSRIRYFKFCKYKYNSRSGVQFMEPSIYVLTNSGGTQHKQTKDMLKASNILSSTT